MKYIIPTILLLALFVNIDQLNAQIIQPAGVQAQDAELWTGIELTKELQNDVDFSIGQQLRFNNNIQRFKSTFTEASFTFRLNKISERLKLNTALRYTYNFKRRRIWRPMVNLSMQLVKNDYVKLTVRSRIQKDLLRFDEQQFDNDFYWRNKATLSINGKRLKPYLGTEIFYNNNNKARELDQFRFIAGFVLKVKKRQDIKFGYIFKEEFNVNNPTTAHVLQVGWDFEVKDFKKKSKKKK